jgi:DNA-cytosine methyltransferase
MNVLSLFDGMSCGQIALNRCGFKIDNYFAAEIDKHAITVTQANYPNTVQLGDVTKVKGVNLPTIDLLIGGSPCQGFSFAGKQLNFDDPRSALFFEFVRLLKETRPKFFLLENVKMKKEYQDVISSYLGVEPIFLNSSLVSAQSRKRLYWTNIPNYLEPLDRGVMLKDIIIEGEVDREKSFCIDANYAKGGNLTQYFEKSRRQLVFSGGAIRGRYLIDGVRQDSKMKTAGLTEQRLEARADGKSNTLTTVQKDNVLIRQLNPSKESGGVQPYQGNRVFDIDYKMTCLSAGVGDRNKVGKITDGVLDYRKLTPVECERLQTVPDNYSNYVSNTQRFRMLGNGWTVDAICQFFKNIPTDLELY